MKKIHPRSNNPPPWEVDNYWDVLAVVVVAMLMMMRVMTIVMTMAMMMMMRVITTDKIQKVLP